MHDIKGTVDCLLEVGRRLRTQQADAAFLGALAANAIEEGMRALCGANQ